MVSVALVVAMADNGVIGRDGALPWHLPDDLKHFKAVTLGKPVLMGRGTFASIGRALPGRRNLVLSRRSEGALDAVAGSGVEPDVAGGVEYVHSLEEACQLAGGSEELCVIGGAQIFALALPRASRIYLTCVHAAVDGDVFFPLAGGAGERSHRWDGWREVARSEHPVDTRHAYAMSFVQLERGAH